jgi:dUTP pyrophosphatase
MKQPIEVITKPRRLFVPAKPGDVGHDLSTIFYSRDMKWLDKAVSLFTRENVLVVLPFSARLIPTGVRINQPDNIWCQIVARSSAAKKSLMVIGGIIDSGYQGDLFAVLHNFSLIPRFVRYGERYAQVIFYPAIRPNIKNVFIFSKGSERGNTGFGSTGQ